MAATDDVAQRLPSTRPIDRRWDRSRGIIFSNATRPTPRNDQTWSHANGIIFADPTPAATRSYAMRYDRTARPPTPTPAATSDGAHKSDGFGVNVEEFQELKRMRVVLDEKVRRLQDDLRNANEDHATKFKRAANDHAKELNKIKEENATSLKIATEEHAKELNKINEDHTIRFKDALDDYERERKEWADTVDIEIQTKIEAKEKQFSDEKADLEEQLAQANRKHAEGIRKMDDSLRHLAEARRNAKEEKAQNDRELATIRKEADPEKRQNESILAEVRQEGAEAAERKHQEKTRQLVDEHKFRLAKLMQDNQRNLAQLEKKHEKALSDERANGQTVQYQRDILSDKEKQLRLASSKLTTLGGIIADSRAHIQDLERQLQSRKKRAETDRGSYFAYRNVFTEIATNVGSLMFTVDDHRGVLMREHNLWLAAFQDFNSNELLVSFRNTDDKYGRLKESINEFLRSNAAAADAAREQISVSRAEASAMNREFLQASHISRRLTKYLHMSGERSLMEGVWLSLGQFVDPLRYRAERLRQADDALQKTMLEQRASASPGQMLQWKKELEKLQDDIGFWVDLCRVYDPARRLLTFKALLNASAAEKKVWLQCWEAQTKLSQANTKFYDIEDDRRRDRDLYLEKERHARNDLDEYESVLRKRALLEQDLGLLTPQHVREFDDRIKQFIAVEEKQIEAGLDRLRPGLRMAHMAKRRRVVAARPDTGASGPKVKTLQQLQASLASNTRVNNKAPGPAKQTDSERLVKKQNARRTKLSPEDSLEHLRVNRRAVAARRERLIASGAPEDSRRVLSADMNMRGLDLKISGAERQKFDTPVRERDGEHLRDDERVPRDSATKRGLSRRERRSLPLSSRSSPRSKEKSSLVSVSDEDTDRKVDFSKTGNAPDPGNPFVSSTGGLNLKPTASNMAKNDALHSHLRHLRAASTLAGIPGALAHIPQYESSLHALGERQHQDWLGFAPSSPISTNMRVSSLRSFSQASTSANTAVQVSASMYASAPAHDGGHVNIQESSSPVKPASCSVSDGQEAKTDVVIAEPQTVLDYNIPPKDYRAAVMASPNSNAAFWSYRLYKTVDGKSPAVYYCKSFQTAEANAKLFLTEPVVGFDLEWEPSASAKSGIKHNISLVQIAAEDRIGLFHLSCFSGNTVDELLPPSLRTILESSKITKTGVNVSGDARRVKTFLGVEMKGVFELSHMFKLVKLSEKDASKVNFGLVSLAKQVEEVLLLPLKKDENRVSHWSRSLTGPQSDYAASDAYAGFRLYHQLDNQRKAMNPPPPRPAFYETNLPIVLGNGTKVYKGQQKSSKTTFKKAIPGKPAVEAEDEGGEEFFDAVEEQDSSETESPETASASEGDEVTYPALLTTRERSVQENPETLRAVSPAPPSSSVDARQQLSAESGTPAAKAVRPETAETRLADEWVSQWRASRPSDYKLIARPGELRAYHLWHSQNLNIGEVAALMKDPPLTQTTVASYVLQALKEDELPFKGERLDELLECIPKSVWGRYWKVVERTKSGRS